MSKVIKVEELKDEELEKVTGGTGTPYIVTYCPTCGYEFDRVQGILDPEGPTQRNSQGRKCPVCRKPCQPGTKQIYE